MLKKIIRKLRIYFVSQILKRRKKYEMFILNLQSRIDLKELCRENGWGYEKFRKIFKQSTGVSPAQYRLRRRLDQAKTLLLSDRDMPLSEIAIRLGYTNVYEFSAQFKKSTGQPPGKFRNQ